MEKFPADVVLIPSRGSGKGDAGGGGYIPNQQSVSIPSRGSGKGDVPQPDGSVKKSNVFKFQSPLGEVVKET